MGCVCVCVCVVCVCGGGGTLAGIFPTYDYYRIKNNTKAAA